MGKHKRQNVIQKRQQKNFTALMKKKERKERRKNLTEHRAQLRENNFLGVFTSIAEYTRRQTFSLATKPLDVHSHAPNESCFVDCYVEKTGYLLKRERKKSFTGYVCVVVKFNKKITIEEYLEQFLEGSQEFEHELRRLASAQRRFIEPVYARRNEPKAFDFHWSSRDGFLILAIHDILQSNAANPFRIITQYGQIFDIDFSQLECLRMLPENKVKTAELYYHICLEETEILRFHTSVSDCLRERTSYNFRNGKKGLEWFLIGFASGSCQDIVHAAKVLIERYPERFGPNGTCFLRCVLLDEKFKFRSFKRQKLFKHANRLVYSGSTDTIVVSSIPMNHQTNVLGQMKELEGFVGRTLFNFVRADYSLFTHCYHFYKIRFQCLLFTAGLSCTPFSRLNTTPKIGHEEGLSAGCDDVLIVFSFIAACACLLFVVENTGSNTSKKTKNRRLAMQPCMQALADYRTTFTHCAICTEFEGLPFVDDDDDDPKIRKKTDCFSNGHRVPHGSCGEEDFFLSNGTKKKWTCEFKHLTNKHTELPNASAARSLWPCNFFRAFCSSLVYVLDGLPLRRLREWGREDENHVREQKRVLLEERFA
jgi:hypothetical protein